VALILGLVTCGPLLLVGVCITLSFAAGTTLQILPMCGFLLTILVAPVAAGLGVSLLYRWSLPRACPRTAVLGSSVAVMALLVSSPESLTTVAHCAEIMLNPGEAHVAHAPSGAQVIDALRHATFIVAFSVSIIMMAVLLIEIPFRLVTSRLRGHYDDGVVRSVRCFLSLFLVQCAWVVIEDGASIRLRELVSSFMR